MKSPFLLRRVVGHSMRPTLAPNDVVLACGYIAPSIGSVVIAKVDGREFIKRVESIENGQVRLVGDNYYHSHDSRQFGPVDKRQILGTVIGYPKTFNAIYRSIERAA